MSKLFKTSVFLCLFFAMGSFAFAEAPRDSYNHQKYLEKEFKKQKAAFAQLESLASKNKINKDNSVELQKFHEQISHQAAPIGKIEALYLKISYYSKEFFRSVESQRQVFSLKIKNLYKEIANLRFSSKRDSTFVNLPPEVSSININKLTSGGHAVTRFFVNSMSDPDDGIAKIRWNFGDGTVVELLAGEFDADASIYHKYPMGGHYAMSLEVEDNFGDITTVTSYVEYTVNSQPAPYFTASADPSNPLTVTFNILSNDPDELTVNTWATVCPSGGTTSKTFTCTFPSAGNYTFQLHSTDSIQTLTYISTTINVGASTVKSNPIAIFDIDNDWGAGPLTVNFDASSAFDLDGSIVSYMWDFSESNNPQARMQGQKVTKTFYQPGTYFVKLTVKDDLGNESDIYREVHVSGGTNPQIVAMNNSPLNVSFYSGRIAMPVPISAQMSYWDFGDGTKYKGTWPNHTYAAAGTYTVTQKLVDLAGVTHNLSKNITVGATADSPNMGFISADKYNAPVFQTTTYTSSAADPVLSLPLNYRWTFFDGQTLSGISNSASKQYADPGFKPVHLIVTNSRGLSALSTSYSEVVTAYNVIFARTTFTPKTGSAPLTVNFSGTNSSAAPGKIISHEWAVNDQVVGFGPTLSYVFTGDGLYNVRYIVTDNIGNQASTNEVVVVNSSTAPPGNTAPNASIAYSVDGGNSRRIYFHCYNSTDDEWVASCQWKLNGVPLQDTKSGQVLLSENIQYTLELTAFDAWGLSHTVSEVFDFTPGPVKIVDFDYSPISPTIFSMLDFAADHAVIPGRTIITYTWDMGDGTVYSGPTAIHGYPTAGTYEVTLTLTDSAAATHVVKKSITVLDAPALDGVEIIARSADGTHIAKSGNTYHSLQLPETIQLTASPTKDAEGLLHDGVWDLGDGKTAFGESIEYRFDYIGSGGRTVTYTGKTPSNNIVTKTINITQLNSPCNIRDEYTYCFDGHSISNYMLDMNLPSWTMTTSAKTIELSADPEDKLTVKLVSQEGEIKEIDISDAVKRGPVGEIVLINDSLKKKNINFKIPYRFKFSGRESSGEYFTGASPIYHFAGASIYIQVSEINAKVELVHTGSGYRQYFDFLSETYKQISSLPYGPYVVIATKGAKKAIRSISAEYGTVYELIDLDAPPPRIKDRKKTTSSFLNKNHPMSLPSWTSGLCGEVTPFKEAKPRDLSGGEVSSRVFSSANPNAQFTFEDVGRNMGQKVKLSCGVTSPALLYAQYKWKYKDGPLRCYDKETAHPLWNEYLKTLSRESSPIVIEYEISDPWVYPTQKGHFVTSARDIMLKSNMSLEDLTGRYGIGTSIDQDWTQRIEYEIPIPIHFRRPQVRFRLTSDHNSSNTDFYSVNCEVIDGSSTPVISDLKVTDFSGFEQSTKQARMALSKSYGFFPIHYDSGPSSAVSLDPAKGKARFLVTVQNRDSVISDWSSIKIAYLYGSQSFTKDYPFVVSEVNSLAKTSSGFLEIDTVDLAGIFSWEPGVKTVTLRMTPSITSPTTVVGEAKDFNFIPLIDAQTVKAEYPQLCSEDFYVSGTFLSTFVRDELLTMLLDGESIGAKLRCGDGSLPFGGEYRFFSFFGYTNHQNGSMIKTRFLNSTGEHDGYDGLYKIDDYSQMTLFSNGVADILGGSSGPTDRTDLYNYCMSSIPPLEPCYTGMLESDLTADIVSRICLLTGPISLAPGCPSVNASKFIRISNWLEKNIQPLSDWKKSSPVKFNIASGFADYIPGAGFDIQKEAFVFGRRTDGYPLWKVSPIPNMFLKERIAACHNLPEGCVQLKDSFTGNQNFSNHILVETGWR